MPSIVTCGPNEALIISGLFHGNEPTMIVGGRALVFPLVQTIQKLPLSTMTLVVQSPKVYTSQGVPISVTGVAQARHIFFPFFRALNKQMCKNSKEEHTIEI